jgi:aspartokinase-like uncharacterized kinase
MTPLLVAKVGGSLFDLPDLRERLAVWLREQNGRRLLLVPGGGAGADVIRTLDRTHQLDRQQAHWLAIRVLSVNAGFLADLLAVPVVSTASDDAVAVLDAHPFCKSDVGRPGALEQSWRVTSDAIAARAAAIFGAELALLKSVDLPKALNWPQAATLGIVDEVFPAIVAAAGLRVRWVNMRQT